MSSPLQTNFAVFLGLLVLGVAAFSAYRYLNQPARVFAAKTLQCSIFSVTTEPISDAIRVKGCGRQIDVYCDPDGCQEAH